jgi:hypothetical protein
VFDSDVDIGIAPRYFGVWNTASDYFVWGESGQSIIESKGYSPDREVLENHKSSLQRVEPLTDASLDVNARANLRQLGYLE